MHDDPLRGVGFTGWVHTGWRGDSGVCGLMRGGCDELGDVLREEHSGLLLSAAHQREKDDIVCQVG
jgi:hypothetical protein